MFVSNVNFFWLIIPVFLICIYIIMRIRIGIMVPTFCHLDGGGGVLPPKNK